MSRLSVRLFSLEDLQATLAEGAENEFCNRLLPRALVFARDYVESANFALTSLTQLWNMDERSD